MFTIPLKTGQIPVFCSFFFLQPDSKSNMQKVYIAFVFYASKLANTFWLFCQAFYKNTT